MFSSRTPAYSHALGGHAGALLACAIWAWPITGAAVQPAVSVVSAEPGTPGSFELRWTAGASDTPIDIFVADRPNAPPKTWRLLADDDRDGVAIVSPAATGRPYFYVTPNRGRGLWTAERALPLQGGRNFRDMGGYATSDGRHVQWGRLYRSGSMAELTTADYDYLGKLGIRVVCDLRTNEERQSEPNRWREVAHLDYWSRDYTNTFGELRQIFAGGTPTAEQAAAAMMAGYRNLPFDQAPAYRELFRRLAIDEIPLAFNCTAGKDRAGTAAAIILRALGVPLETVIVDYVLTDKYLDYRQLAKQGGSQSTSPMATMPREVIAAVLRADPIYIRAALSAIDEKHGSIEGYLRDELNVSARDLRRIRRQLLE